MKKIKWRYNIGDRIVSPTDNKEKFDYTITNRETRQAKHKKKNGDIGYDYYQEQYYEYSCNICGATKLWKRMAHIGKSKCSCCSNKIRIRGINTIGDLYPELISYFNKDDAFNPKLDLDSRYDVICPNCGHKKNMRVGHLLDQNFICDYCNSIGVKRPELVKYFINQDEAYTVSYGSNSKILLQCPDCGERRYVSACNIYKKGFNCNRCGDGIPFPEKFMNNLLTQLGVKFIFQANSKVFNWCERLRYDFYIPDISTIIEVHGAQHYKSDFKHCSGQSLETIQKNDIYKKQLALNNGITTYITIDCSWSNTKWIANSIINSKISELFNLQNVDWNACAHFAMSNISKKICTCWRDNYGHITTTILAKQFNLCTTTITKYLKQGTELGWCEYDAEKELEKGRIKSKETCSKPVIVLKNNQSVGIFDSIAELERQSDAIYGIHFPSSTICNICKGKMSQSNGYRFKYIDK